MKYTELFKRTREAKGLTHENLARAAGCHRNTVINVETGRPVKFKTIGKMMTAMKASKSDMATIALLWVESTSGLEIVGNAKAMHNVTELKKPEELALANLRESAKKLTRDDIELLAWAADNCGALQMLKGLKDPSTLKC